MTQSKETGRSGSSRDAGNVLQLEFLSSMTSLGAGGLATVFPGTATVEADFSNLKWTKDVYSTSLSDFSLEAKLHTRQFHLIQSI